MADKEQERLTRETYYQKMKNSEELRRKTIEWNRSFRKVHGDLIRQNRRNAYRILRLKVLKLLGNKCVNPYNLPHFDWNNDPNLLQIDHINGGGCKELRDSRDSKGYLRSIYHNILEGENKYQLLCPNCNWLKRIKNKEINRRTGEDS